MSLAAGTEVQGPACRGGRADLGLPAGIGASTKDKELDSVVLNSSFSRYSLSGGTETIPKHVCCCWERVVPRPAGGEAENRKDIEIGELLNVRDVPYLLKTQLPSLPQAVTLTLPW